MFATAEELSEVDGIGSFTAQQIRESWTLNTKLIHEKRQYCVYQQSEGGRVPLAWYYQILVGFFDQATCIFFSVSP